MSPQYLESPVRREEEDALEAFVGGLVEPGCPAVPAPACLLRMAARVLRQAKLEERLSPEDLVGQLTVRLLEGARHKPRAPIKCYRGVLAYRLRQLATEAVPSRHQFRELKGHVVRALKANVGACPDPRPEVIEMNGRFVRAHVFAAVAWALAQPNPPRSARALTAFLMEQYSLGARHVALEELSGEGLKSGELASAGLLAADLRQHLGERAAHMVGSRVAGRPLEEIARSVGVGTTTAFEQLRRSEAVVLRVVHGWKASHDLAQSALRLLADAASARGRVGPARDGRRRPRPTGGSNVA